MMTAINVLLYVNRVEKYVHDVHIEADPSEESYAFGYELSLTCNVTNPQTDIDLPLMVEWYVINGGELNTRSPSLPTSYVSSVKVTLQHSSMADYFCRVYSVADDGWSRKKNYAESLQ